MKRTKYDAPAPRVRECEVDVQKIWNKKKTVSEELTLRILKTLRGEGNAERITYNARSSAEVVLDQ